MKGLKFYSNGATWFATHKGKDIAEADVTARTKDNPPKWFVKTAKEYIQQKYGKKIRKVI